MGTTLRVGERIELYLLLLMMLYESWVSKLQCGKNKVCNLFKFQSWEVLFKFGIRVRMGSKIYSLNSSLTIYFKFSSTSTIHTAEEKQVGKWSYLV